MRHCLREIANGAEAKIELWNACYDFCVVTHVKEGVDAWTEPTDESALSEKEGKNRGCC